MTQGELTRSKFTVADPKSNARGTASGAAPVKGVEVEGDRGDRYVGRQSHEHGCPCIIETSRCRRFENPFGGTARSEVHPPDFRPVSAVGIMRA